MPDSSPRPSPASSPSPPDGLSTHQRHFMRLAQFNTWFNGQLYDHVARLDDDERHRDRGAFFGSIHATLDHLLLCDRSWLGRIRKSGLPFPSLAEAELIESIERLDQSVCPRFEDLRAARSETDAVLEAFVAELTPELLAGDLSYHNSKGVPFTHPLWHVVAHVFNHQTHHRGQITTLLSQQGVDPGITDFLVTSMMPFPGSEPPGSEPPGSEAGSAPESG